MNNAGRKPKYPTDLLYTKLIEYSQKHPNTIIKYSALEKHFGIPRHIWRDNEEIKSVIHKTNNPQIITDTQNMIFELPTTDDIMMYFGNKKKMEKSISDLLSFSQSLYEKALKGENFEKLESHYKIQINELTATYENKLSIAYKEIEKLNKEIDELYLDSRNSLIRRKQGLKDNMIDISKHRTKEISKDMQDIQKEFKSLFDD